jgi:hypothetical protein
MRRSLFIAFTLLVCFLAGDPWVVIHTCGGETEIDLFAGSAADPCGCGNEAPADRCCTLVMTSFTFDAAPPAAPLVAVASLEAPTATVPTIFELPLRPPERWVVASESRPPGTPSLNILYCSFLI